MAAHDLRRAINLLGSQEKPFLFAIDFSVCEGWVWEEPLAQQEVLFRVGSYTNAPLTAELPPLPHHPLLVAHPLSRKPYHLYSYRDTSLPLRDIFPSRSSL